MSTLGILGLVAVGLLGVIAVVIFFMVLVMFAKGFNQ